MTILNVVDAVVVLPGWHNSAGARLETAVAIAIGTPVYGYVDGELHPIRPEISTTVTYVGWK